MKKGSVILVGAGCGKGLMTLSGLEAIKKADVILYDDLIDQDLLNYTKQNCERLYVGKRRGKHSMKQEEINELLVRNALDGFDVVRLKGGDSFVFGRGGEEVLALEEAGIYYELIPGISSSIAVPEHAGIPVTHRMDARSFTVVTGHTANGEEESFEALAKLKGTLVFLMGLKNAAHIAEELMRFGKDPKTPAAVLSKGYSEDEKRYDCTLETLGETANQAETPAILVIGNTASYHMRAEKPQDGFSVQVTGTSHFIQQMKDAFEYSKARILETPTIEINYRSSLIPENLDEYEWLIFTSANGINGFFYEMRHMRGMDLRRILSHKFAVIGKGTAATLKRFGVHADFIPSKYVSDVFGREFGAYLKEQNCKKPVLILRAKNGAAALTEELDRAGISYEDVPIYETEEIEQNEAEYETPEYVTFASASGVKAYFNRFRLSEETTPVCIGPTTAAAFEECSERTYLMPAEHTARGMAALIEEHRSRECCSEKG